MVNPGCASKMFTLCAGIRNLFELEGQRKARVCFCPPPAQRNWDWGTEPAVKKKKRRRREAQETCLQSISFIDLLAGQLLVCFGILILSAGLHLSPLTLLSNFNLAPFRCVWQGGDQREVVWDFNRVVGSESLLCVRNVLFEGTSAPTLQDS